MRRRKTAALITAVFAGAVFRLSLGQQLNADGIELKWFTLLLKQFPTILPGYDKAQRGSTHDSSYFKHCGQVARLDFGVVELRVKSIFKPLDFKIRSPN